MSQETHNAIKQGEIAAAQGMTEDHCPYGCGAIGYRCAWLAGFRDRMAGRSA